MEMWQIVSTVVISAITAGVAALTSRTQSQGELEAEKIKTRGEEWSSIVSTLKEHSEERFEDYEKRLDLLEERFGILSKKYGVSLGHILEIRNGHPDPSRLPMIPGEISMDVYGYTFYSLPEEEEEG